MRNITKQFTKGQTCNIIIPHNDYRTEQCRIISDYEGDWIVESMPAASASKEHYTPLHFLVSNEYLAYCNAEKEETAEGYIDITQYMPEFKESILTAKGKPPYTYEVTHIGIRKTPVQNISAGRVVGSIYIQGQTAPIQCSKVDFCLLPSFQSVVNLKYWHKIPEFETPEIMPFEPTDTVASMDRTELLKLAKEYGVEGKIITFKTEDLRDKVKERIGA